MICRVGDVVRCGRVVSVEMGVEPVAIAAAIREDRGPDDRIAVSCPDPTPLHESVGCLRPDMGLRTKTAVARAARTCGETTPYDADLRAARDDLADVTVETTSLDAHRERIAQAESAVDQARIRAAEARGRVRERRENDLAIQEARSRLDDALRELSEAETDAIATRQEYEQARERRRDRRDVRERKRRLEDRVANLERQARSHLLTRYQNEFREALATVPGASVDPENADPFAADAVTAALAVARIGELTAPVVIAVDRFESPEHASEFLDAPVVQV